MQTAFPNTNLILVAESAGGIGLCYSNYKVLETKNCGPNGTVFHVERPLSRSRLDKTSSQVQDHRQEHLVFFDVA